MMATQTKDGFSVFDDMEEFQEWEANVLATTTKVRDETHPGVRVRTDIIGQILDGYDHVLNNPPGFATGAALEYMKEHDIDYR